MPISAESLGARVPRGASSSAASVRRRSSGGGRRSPDPTEPAGVPSGLHPVATDRHRAPTRTPGPAVVDQEQPAGIVLTGSKAPGGLLSESEEGQDGPGREHSLRFRCQPPGQAAVHGGRDLRHTRDMPTKHVRRSLTPDDSLQVGADCADRGQLGGCAEAAPFTQPVPTGLVVRELINGLGAHHRGAVQQREQQTLVRFLFHGVHPNHV